jgi:hypothetical protein
MNPSLDLHALKHEARHDPRVGDVWQNASKKRSVEAVGYVYGSYISGTETFNSGYQRRFAIRTREGWIRWTKSAKLIHRMQEEKAS